MTQISFEDRTQTKKGALGEEIVDRILREKGFVIYKPEGGQAHAFDRLAIKDKEILLIAEVKSKAKRKYYPDTGFNYKHYLEYKKIMERHNLQVVIFFVDEENKSIYGGKLKTLEQIKSFNVNGKEVTYPKIENGIIYFHIETMTHYASLTGSDALNLTELTTKNIAYIPKPIPPQTTLLN